MSERDNRKANAKWFDGIRETRKKISASERARVIRGDFTRKDPVTGDTINMNDPGALSAVVDRPTVAHTESVGTKTVFAVGDWKDDIPNLDGVDTALGKKLSCTCGGSRGFQLTIRGEKVIRTCLDCEKKVAM